MRRSVLIAPLLRRTVGAPGSVGHGFSHDGTRLAGEPGGKGS